MKTTTFRALPVGVSFYFADGSFLMTATKVSPRMYTTPGDATRYEIGNVDSPVVHIRQIGDPV